MGSGSDSSSNNVFSRWGNANQQSSFNQKVFEPQGSALQGMYAQLPQQYQDTAAAIAQQIPGLQNQVNNSTQSGLSGWQNNLGGGVYNGMDNAGQLGASLQQSLNSPTNTQQIYAGMMGGQGNNYADAMKNSYINDANKAAENMNANLDARASAAGMGGSSRQGVAQALGYRDINQNLQNQMAKTGYNTFNQDLQNKLGIASQADSQTLARQQMLQGMLSQQQATQSGAVGQTGAMQNNAMGQLAPAMANWSNLANYNNAIGAPTILGNGNSQGSAAGGSSGSGSSNGSSTKVL